MSALGKLSRRLSSSSLFPAILIPRRGMATRLFVGGLSAFTTEQRLSEAFSQYGQVTEASILMDRVSDRSKGFGFVTFASEDAAENALTEMNGRQLNGRIIFVDYANPRSRWMAQKSPETTLENSLPDS